MKKILVAGGCLALVVALFLLALPSILHRAGLHPEYTGETIALPGKRALVITTSHDRLAAPGEQGAGLPGSWHRNSRIRTTVSWTRA